MGVCLQLLWSRVAPVGATAYPDAGPAAVAAVAVAGALLQGRPAWTPGPASLFPGGAAAVAALLGLAAALAVGRLGQFLTVRERHGNARLVLAAEAAAGHGSFPGVERANALGVARAFARGLGLFAATIGVLMLSAWLLPDGLHVPPLPSFDRPNPGPGLVWFFGLAAILTVLWKGGRRDWMAVTAGLLLSVIAGRLW
jgi:mannose/fructose/N-acetylgalactosamine-specific phosphotransferase system component IIC